ncbi:hypothetical protein NDU88_000435 [Pleurodeles waltl]|uniref:Uncharacterized protein n=1 Tax=Pleurodeles waltl TaxID=8319 RepID=A0AAV7TF09_PLEWA|nr:hypothetical protein NDU88_000435 [Pleurodeles waltl]
MRVRRSGRCHAEDTYDADQENGLQLQQSGVAEQNNHGYTKSWLLFPAPGTEPFEFSQEAVQGLMCTSSLEAP